MLAQAIAILAATPLNFIGNKLWSFGDPAGPAAGRPAASRLAARLRRLRRCDRAVRAVARARAGRARPSAQPGGGPSATLTRPALPTQPPRDHFLNAVQATRIAARASKGEGRAARHDGVTRRDVRQGPGPLAGELVRRRRRDRPGDRRRARGARGRGLDRPAGRVADGPRAGGRVRPQGQLAVGLDPADGRLLRRRSSTRAGRCGCCTSTCWSCSRSPSRTSTSTAARSTPRCRSSIRCWPTCSCAC